MRTADQNLLSRAAAPFTCQIKGIAAAMKQLRDAAHHLTETECDLSRNWGDPWSQPQIRAMSQRELADLPFPRRQKNF